MYQYTEFDRQFIRNRAAQYRDQLERNLAGTCLLYTSPSPRD